MRIPTEVNLRGKEPIPSMMAWIRKIVAQTNALSEGRIHARHNALAAAPTTGDYMQGDIVWNSTPTEQGSASSKYVIIGWINVSSGSPGTFVEMRCLTGN